jgi:hypothetical protein
MEVSFATDQAIYTGPRSVAALTEMGWSIESAKSLRSGTLLHGWVIDNLLRCLSVSRASSFTMPLCRLRKSLMTSLRRFNAYS